MMPRRPHAPAIVMSADFRPFTGSMEEKQPRFPKIQVHKPTIKELNFEEQNKIFEFIQEKHLPIFTFMRFTGCPPNEAQGLLKEKVDFINKKVLLSTVLTPKKGIKNSTKTRQVKPLPIIPEIEDILKMGAKESPLIFTIDGRPYTLRRLEKIWHRANSLVNKKYKTKIINLYNGLKHSFGMQRLDDGYNLDELKKVYGHSNIATTQGYADYRTGRLVDIMRVEKKLIAS